MTYLSNRLKNVDEEQLCAKVLVVHAVLVQFRHGHEDVVVNNPVEQSDADDWCDGPEGVPEQQVCVVEHAGGWQNSISMRPHCGREGGWQHSLLTAPRAVYLEPPQDADADHVLVKEVHDPVQTVST